MKFRPILLTLITLLMALGCTSPQDSAEPIIDALPSTEAINPTPIPPTTQPPTARPEPTPTAIPERQQITIPIAIYILDDEDGIASSERTVEELESVYEKVNDIWSQADINIEVMTIERVTVPSQYLGTIAQSSFFDFFGAVNQEIVELPQFAPIIGFYVKGLGGPNGIHPSNSNTFFVMDTPSVHDERVTSHEIGHILGLHHVLDDAGRLLYSGTNGITLSEEEQTVARYAAVGLLLRVR